MPQLTIGVQSTQAVSGTLGRDFIRCDFSGLKLFDEVHQLANVGMAERDRFGLRGGACGFEPAVDDRSIQVEVLDLFGDLGQFGFPGFNDRQHFRQDAARKGWVGGVAVGGEGDGFGFGEVEILDRGFGDFGAIEGTVGFDGICRSRGF